MTIVIRPLDDRDSIAELTAMLHAAYASLAAMGFNYTAVDQSEDVTRERITGGECYVAADGQRLVGTVLFYRHAPWYKQPNVADFGQFGVLPNYQRMGLGRRLMEHVEARALTTGATELWLNTSEGANHLIRWYENLGYRLNGHIQWDGKTYRSVIMAKRLEPA